MSWFSSLFNSISRAIEDAIKKMTEQLSDLAKKMAKFVKTAVDIGSVIFAPAFNAFKFAKALVTGDIQGMKDALKDQAMLMGGNLIEQAIESVKLIASGKIIEGLRGLAEVAAETVPGAGAVVARAACAVLNLAEAIKDGELKGILRASLAMTPLQNVSETGFEVADAAADGDVMGGVRAGMRSTSLGSRADGAIEVAEAFRRGRLRGSMHSRQVPNPMERA